ncbi:hypothetical protein SISNIDRAFT_545646 [Sistotremastrum niveocremeum HHB9708]|uniref:DUF6535 domain-containing protein n=1 Tax=Sistotremastrum niveocremeum HHB9708 TaxID=1314777 RepID=A0A165AB64_9AGAM|nr:hypothetical protein SISNIDRAFT_545646 [Sistotremastrum niveocremeum HHB9708]
MTISISPEDSPRPDIEAQSNSPAMTMLTTQFDLLIAAVKELNVTMVAQKSTMDGMKATMESQKTIAESQTNAAEGMKKTLEAQSLKFDILTRDAEKGKSNTLCDTASLEAYTITIDDKPYDEKPLVDDSTSSALYKIAVAKTKEKADRWNGRIDITLIFVALFSAVITGFVVLMIQTISPAPTSTDDSGSTSSSPPPTSSDQWITALYSLSLITSIIVAVLCVLCREWVRKLTIMPTVASWKDRTLWHVERARRSEGWIATTMEIIYRLLLASIGLFIAGLLYHLWSVAMSFDQRATVLLATWGIGIGLASVILITIIATVFHAVRYEGSAFDGFASRIVVRGMERLMPILAAGHLRSKEMILQGWRWATELALVRYWKGMSIKPQGRFKMKNLAQKKPSDVEPGSTHPEPDLTRSSPHAESKSESIHAPAASGSGLSSTAVAKAEKPGGIHAWRVKVNCDSMMDEWAGTYMELIAEASDSTLVERAAASFSYRNWIQHGDGSLERLKRVCTRLAATDTSIRVQSIVHAQVSRFVSWFRKRQEDIAKYEEEEMRRREWTSYAGGYELPLKEMRGEAEKEKQEAPRTVELTKFVLSQRTDDISRFFSPDEQNYAEILEYFSLPFEEFVAKCLSIHNEKKSLGDHHHILFWAVNYCNELLDAKKRDDAMRVLSHADLISAIKSFALDTHYSHLYPRVLELLIGDRRDEVLLGLNKFLQEHRNWTKVDRVGVQDIFATAAWPPSSSEPELEPDYDLDSASQPEAEFHFQHDLSALILHISKHPSTTSGYWDRAMTAALEYLKHFDLSNLADPYGVYNCLQYCADPYNWNADGDPTSIYSDIPQMAQSILAQHQDLFSWFLLPYANDHSSSEDSSDFSDTADADEPANPDDPETPTRSENIGEIGYDLGLDLGLVDMDNGNYSLFAYIVR